MPIDEDDDNTATRALAGLRLEDQKVITLCVLFNYTAAEAASVLNIPVGTVKSRLSRAKTRLSIELTTQNV